MAEYDFIFCIVTTLDRAHAEDALLPIARVADLHEKKSVQPHSSDQDTDMIDQSQAGEFLPYMTVLKSTIRCLSAFLLILFFFNLKFQIMKKHLAWRIS